VDKLLANIEEMRDIRANNKEASEKLKTEILKRMEGQFEDLYKFIRKNSGKVLPMNLILRCSLA